MHTQRDRQVVHALDASTRLITCRCRRPCAGQVIVGRQQGRRVRRRQCTARQGRRIQVRIQEVHTDIERLGEVVLEAGTRRPDVEVVVTSRCSEG